MFTEANKVIKVFQIVMGIFFILAIVLFFIGTKYEKNLKEYYKIEDSKNEITAQKYAKRNVNYLKENFKELPETKLSVLKKAEETQPFFADSFKNKNYKKLVYTKGNKKDLLIWKPVNIYFEQFSKNNINFSVGIINIGDENLKLLPQKTQLITNDGEILSLIPQQEYTDEERFLDGNTGNDYIFTFKSEKDLTENDLKNSFIHIVFTKESNNEEVTINYTNE